MPKRHRRSSRCAQRALNTTARRQLLEERLEPRYVFDSTVVFNEIMFHPQGDETKLEWIELHNQQAVDMDLSGWSLAGGIGYNFPNGTIVAGGARLVVAISPADLQAASGYAGALGPFTGSLNNSGETLELHDNNGRVMDSVTYGDDGAWPVAPDGGGVSLAKTNSDLASDVAASWAASSQIGGTPGAVNFQTAPVTQTTNPVTLTSTWKYNQAGVDLGTSWRNPGYDDSTWASGAGLLAAGTGAPASGQVQAITTLFNTGIGANGLPIAAGSPDPHYTVTAAAQGPINVAATVIQNHPAWSANDAQSSWLGPVNPGVTNVAAGAYNFRTTFSLTGYLPGTASLTLYLQADNRVNDVLINGVSTGINVAGFSGPIGPFTISSGFIAGINTIDFLTANDGPGANPGGFRAVITGTAQVPTPTQTTLNLGPNTYYLRDTFQYTGDPTATVLKLRSYVDDGAVFYLNGTRVAAVNMADGEPTYASKALTNIGNPSLSTYLTLPPGALINGTNVLAVEVHQALGGDADMLFGAEVTATETLFDPATAVTKAALNEIAASGVSGGFIEIVNYGATTLQLGGFKVTNSSGAQYILPAQTLAPGAKLALTDTQLGFSLLVDSKVFLYKVGGAAIVDAATVRAATRGRLPEGTGEWMYPSQDTPGATNVFSLHDEIVINEIMYHHQSLPATELVVQNTTPVALDANWKYDQAGIDRGTTWKNVGFDDTSWSTGQGILYAGNIIGSQQQVTAPITTLFSTGIGSDGLQIAPGNPDPHYLLTVSAQGTPPPPSVPATVILNHPAWSANNAQSSWLGPVNPGDTAVAAGQYNFRTSFDLTGFVPSSAAITLYMHADNRVSDVLINGISTGINLAGFNGALLGPFTINSGFISGINTLEFVTVNDGPGANPGGFRAQLSGTALTVPLHTELALGPDTYYFRNTFQFTGNAAATQLQLSGYIDDGAVYYLNGVELTRQNMPQGAIGYSTPASSDVGQPSSSVVFNVPAGILVQGTNVLAVEVHQSSAAKTDMAFGAQLTAVETITPAQPLRESPEEWLELFNRSNHSVDLTGWRLDEGIDFNFPAGTTIGAGQYLVVAKDAAALHTLYPSIAIIGNYASTLGNSGDTVVLKDAVGNPADKVSYADAGRWNATPDGGGSSLELRDPDSDNSQPEAWAASDESTKSQWNTYTYRGVASASAVGPDGQWNEFVMGLLDAGEVLLDDIHVIENPSGAHTELLQNSTFENTSASWRILGNHSHSEVIVDPTNAANHVLRFVATGPTESMLNHAETTLKSGANFVAVQNGTEYEISFRAKWVSGSSALNTRLYFNRVAETTNVAVPQLNGTPGAQNSRYQANVGPTYSDFRHGPVVPLPGDAVTVTMQAADPDGVASALVWYSVNGGAWASVPMNTGGGGVYVGTIPGQAAAALVQFYVQATDTLGASSTFPAAGANSRALYQVSGGAALMASAHNLRVLMTPADTTLLYAPTNVMSDDELGATVVYDDQHVYYDVDVSLQGSQRGRLDSNRVGMHIGFAPDNLFRGVQSSISIDRSGGYSGQGGKQDEILLKQARNHAGDIPSMYDDLVNLIAPQSDKSGTGLMLMARYGSDYLDSAYKDGSDGTVFKFELVYYPLTTVDGNVESLKLPQPDGVVGTDISNLGNDKENYRYTYLIQSHRDADDYSRIMQLAKAFNLNGAELDAATKELMDIDEWMATFAAMSLSGVGDIYTQGNYHNLQLYVRPEDNKVLAMPWDWDFGYVNAINAPLWGDSNLSKIIALPGNQRVFYAYLQDQIATTFNAAYLQHWTTNYGNVIGQNYAGAQNYLVQRAAYVSSALPAAIPFNITTNGGNPVTVATASTTIGGDAWFNVKQIFIEGRATPLDLTWSDPDSWTANVPLVNGTHVLNFQGYDLHGNLVASDSITVTSSFVAPTQADNLRITELMYRPADPPVGSPYVNSDFEYIELQNIGSQPLQLGGATLASGVDFTFPTQTLAPGAMVLVVNNLAAFQSRYGTNLNVAGEFSGNLNNSGEQIQLLDSLGAVVLNFSYAPAWAPVTNTAGKSLVKKDATAATSTWADSTAWRASRDVGGSPGFVDPNVAIAGRHVFYNNSVFDGNNAAATAQDDAAVATDKVALLPGGTATLSNYTSYSRGINGVMVDVLGLSGPLTASNFVFRMGNDNNPAGWALAPAPSSITVRPGAGDSGSDRVTILWVDGVIQRQWLQVTVATSTGLNAPDVFYFGNAVGESGGSPGNAQVNSSDELEARNNPRSFLNPAPVDFAYDYNRDGFVNATDQIIARSNSTTLAVALHLINVPGSAAPTLASIASVGDSAQAASDTVVIAQGLASAQATVSSTAEPSLRFADVAASVPLDEAESLPTASCLVVSAPVPSAVLATAATSEDELADALAWDELWLDSLATDLAGQIKRR